VCSPDEPAYALRATARQGERTSLSLRLAAA
jgi:hypothetical protein